MPAIPASTRSSITLRLLRHAEEHWPKLENLKVTCRSGFAYATAALPGEDEPQPLFRLRYGGSAHSYGFALWSWAAGRYEDSVLLTGSPVGTPQEALDTACTLYYADVADETDTRPQTNLRGQPLSPPGQSDRRTSPGHVISDTDHSRLPGIGSGQHRPFRSFLILLP